ncbi:uncharacterized protein RCH25_036047 [Pelodytes ibericus]
MAENMRPRGLLDGIFLCVSIWLLFDSAGGNGSWLLPDKDLGNEEDIRKEVDQALQQMNKPSFQGWPLDQLKQVVPRLHIGLIEIWLQFRKIPKEQNEMWRKIRHMTRQTTASCQEVKAEMLEHSGNVTSKLDAIAKEMATIHQRVETMEDTCRVVSGSLLALNQTKSTQQTPPTAASRAQGAKNHKANTEKLSQKVVRLTELLNDHNQLLAELYQRITALEGTQEEKQRVSPEQQEDRNDSE